MNNNMKYETRTVGRIMLNANELPCNLSKTILQEIKESLDTIAFNRYPDEKETELLQTYGNLIGMDSSYLLAGNGSDQMLGYLIGSFLGYGKTLFTNDPDFSMYDYYAASYETTVKKYKSNAWDVDEFIALSKQEKRRGRVPGSRNGSRRRYRLPPCTPRPLKNRNRRVWRSKSAWWGM